MKGVLVDITKCIGCGSCTVACKMYNKTKFISDRVPAGGELAKLADENWTVIRKVRLDSEKKTRLPALPMADSSVAANHSACNRDKNGEVWRFVKEQCLHCDEPACAESCFAKETIGIITVEKLTQFINSVSTPERKVYFLQALVQLLIQKERFEEVKKLSLLADKPDEIMTAANISRIETLTKEKKFDEADKFTAAISDAQLKQAVLRHIILERIKNGDAENATALAEKILTEDERKAASELQSQIPKVAEIEEPSERTAMYQEILEAQLGLFDIKGAKETIALMLKNTASVKDPVERIVHQLALAGAQADLNDKSGAAENLRSLIQFLAEIKDITALKGLVPEEKENPAENQAGNQLVLDLKKPVSEEDIREKLIEMYVSAADIQARIGAFDEGKNTLFAAKEQITLLKDSSKKIPLLLLLAQMISEFETEKNKKQ
ncbi:hypothetical protein FACS189427_04380 [Planctomycetales bacterium]|nr:hypothetical protein FACS189427_04380 [Planctomycetales bacterium]